ncbi:MAG: pilus assembly protein [Alphaproteobacteria bacterium]|nr:pilus assembly protein [Alphaproteobacteria bacterium]
MRRVRRSLLRDRSGTAALELCMMFPFMMVLYFGAIEVTQMVRVYMGLGVTTEAMADLLSHGDPDTAAQILDACNGAKLVLAPFSGSTLKAAISTVKNTSGTISVSWSDTSCGTATAINNAVTLGTALVPNSGDEVILVKTSYVYTASTSYVMPATQTYTYLAYARPRVPPS